MENNGNIPHQQRSTLSLSTNHNAQETQATTSDNVNNAAFVNHGMVWPSMFAPVVPSLGVWLQREGTRCVFIVKGGLSVQH
jgi:hypothetical protein